MKLHYFYDQEADVFYFSQGKPSVRSITQETSDDVVLRLDPKTKNVTVFNFGRRARQKGRTVELPIEVRFKPAT